MNKSKGFTLIEMAIVLAVIGLIAGAVLLRSGSVIGDAKTTGTIVLIKDLTAAISDFKNRYRYFPGDFPKAGDDISGITPACNIDPSTQTLITIGNGQIDTDTETTCASVELVLAGLIKGSTKGIFSPNNFSAIPDVFVTARRTTGLLPPAFLPSVQNEIQLKDQPCDTVRAIDSKLDDGNLATGNIRASVALCTPGSAMPVPFLDIGL